jgi:hypothetical protein
MDICRTEGLRDSCLLTNVEHNRYTGKHSTYKQNPEQTRPSPPVCFDMAYVSTPRTNENMRKMKSRMYGTLYKIFLDWGPVPHFCPLETLQPVWLTPEIYCIIPVFLIVPTLVARSLSRPQPAVAPLAATGGNMCGNSGQVMPGIYTQGSLTCRKSATWDR